MTEQAEFKVGDYVLKVGEDSLFEGVIVAVFTKVNGTTVRYVVENTGGVLHIASGKQLRLMSPPPVISPPME